MDNEVSAITACMNLAKYEVYKYKFKTKPTKSESIDDTTIWNHTSLLENIVLQKLQQLQILSQNLEFKIGYSPNKK